MKFSGKMRLKIVLKVKKSRFDSLIRRYTFRKTTGERGVKLTSPPSRFRVKTTMHYLRQIPSCLKRF